MIFYIFLYLVVFFISLLPDLFKWKFSRVVCVCSITIIFILVCGLKSTSVGTDSSVYYEYYSLAKDGNLFSKVKNFEIGYSIYSRIFSKLGIHYNVYLIISYSIVFIPISILFYYFSKNLSISYCSLFAFDSFTFFESGLRQSIAIGFILIGIVILLKLKNRILPIIFYVIAILFHKAAAITLPIFIISFKKDLKSSLYFFIVASFAIVAIGPMVYDSFSRIISVSYIIVDNNSGGMFLVYLLITLVLCFMDSEIGFKTIKLIDKEFEINAKEYNQNIYYVCLGLALVFKSTIPFSNNIGRFSLFFIIPASLLFPLEYKRFKKPLFRNLIFVGMICVFLFLYWATTLRNNGLNVMPYKLFF